jgi:hypothetical protein
MMKKIKGGFAACLKCFKAHPVVMLVVLVVFAIVIAPFLFVGFNRVKNASPLAAAIPDAKPLEVPTAAAAV